MTLFKKAKAFGKDKKGASLVEYGVALLVVVIVGTGAMIALGQNTNTRINDGATAVAKKN